ncbi:PhoP regulatory network YrbL family protein [Ruegeria sp. 2012CJ41-6]|uniref:PhoP regulatory network YrbL family protein n=1 Tax=Ruegeria spongiae TaxID=2942209 RepID=A0ABT0PYV2_9RHOB|nr:YrbL family protein [Ruegeria spongiae]MCL6282741.1 PhoP regulatory network YrbL family protein [Ruegeria spongiae]
MLFAAKLFHLSDLEPVASGGHRTVYACPGEPDLLIKIKPIREYYANHTWAKRLAWKLFPDSVHRNTLKEIECELKTALKVGSEIARTPLARSLGVVQTDLGPGSVFERITSKTGELATHLSSICHDGQLSDAMLRDLNDLVGRLFHLQVVARDIHEANIVYGHRGEVQGFFLIDGYGERNMIPLRSMSRRLNDRSLNKQMRNIATRTGLIWDKATRAFSKP